MNPKKNPYLRIMLWWMSEVRKNPQLLRIPPPPLWWPPHRGFKCNQNTKCYKKVIKFVRKHKFPPPPKWSQGPQAIPPMPGMGGGGGHGAGGGRGGGKGSGKRG